MPVTKRCSIRKLFKAIDSDGSGEISLTELKTAFKKAAGADNKLSFAELKKSCRKASARKRSVRKSSARRGYPTGPVEGYSTSSDEDDY